MRRGKTMWPITHNKKKNYRSRLTNDPYVNHLARTMTKKLMKTNKKDKMDERGEILKV